MSRVLILRVSKFESRRFERGLGDCWPIWREVFRTCLGGFGEIVREMLGIFSEVDKPSVNPYKNII